MAWLAAAVVSIVILGCGSPADERLAIDDAADVAMANLNLSQHCINELAGEERVDVSIDEVIEAPRTLIRIFRQDPEAIYQPGGEGEPRSMRQVLSDSASSMDSCDPAISRELDRALDATR